MIDPLVPYKRPTPVIEKLFLFAAGALIPFEGSLWTVSGVSTGFILFGLIGLYASFWHASKLAMIARQPVLRAGYALVLVGLFMEIAHDSYVYSEAYRIGFMLLGAALITALCRDRSALRALLTGYLAAGTVMGWVLLQSAYSVLGTTETSGFFEASRLRVRIIEQLPLIADLNDIGYLLAEAAIIAFVLMIASRGGVRSQILFVVSAFCLVSVFVSGSRGALLASTLAIVVVLSSYRGWRTRRVIVLLSLSAAAWIFAPSTVFLRLVPSAEMTTGPTAEPRLHVYSTVLKHFPEYALAGVGASGYGDWGRRVGLFETEGVIGTHNSFAQVTVHWGVLGLGALLVLLWRALLLVPTRAVEDPLCLCILGIAAVEIVKFNLIHAVYAKSFALILGMLLAGALWLWPQERRNSPG